MLRNRWPAWTEMPGRHTPNPAEKSWGLPAGGQLPGETPEECCRREVWEETGYRVVLRRELQVKTGNSAGRPFALHLFEAVVVDGQPEVHDPDGLIHEVAWCGAAEIERLTFTFQDDKDWVLAHLSGRSTGRTGPGGAVTGKLVRDRIPELMATQGQPARFRAAEARDMPELLLAKVQEEAAEVVASGGSITEVVDLLEALDALARCHGYLADEVMEQRARKFRGRGGFERGFVLLRDAAGKCAEGQAQGMEARSAGLGKRVVDCIFCSICMGEASASVVWEGEHTVAIMDLNQPNPYKVLIIPRRHVETIYELGDDLAADVFRTAVRVARAVRDTSGCPGLNVIQSNGEVGQQDVFHFHLHLLPRFARDGVMLRWADAQADRATLDRYAEELRSRMSGA